MIQNLHPDVASKLSIDAVLYALQQSRFTFTLTGSRFFGHAKEDSDWDFFIQKSAELVSNGTIEQFLTKLGFVELSERQMEENYRESLTICKIFRFAGKIDVQLVNDWPLKNKVNQILFKLRGMLGLAIREKHEMKHIWNTFLDAMK